MREWLAGRHEWRAGEGRRRLENRLTCVRDASNRADGETQARLRQMLAGLEIETVLAGLLETLKEAVLIVGASVGVGGAFGASVGGDGDGAPPPPPPSPPRRDDREPGRPSSCSPKA